MTSILSHLKPVFNATKSNAIISKSKHVLWLSFLHLRNLNKIWITLKQKMSLRVYFLMKLETPKSGFTSMAKEPCIRTLMQSQHVKGSETLLDRSIFLISFDHSEKKISSKNSVLLVSEILTLLVNILTPDDKYFLSIKASV